MAPVEEVACVHLFNRPFSIKLPDPAFPFGNVTGVTLVFQAEYR
ncbi:hypothetical protein NBRC3257_2908 [Gluconobacter thailandicus NBRC 3257]|uniref:Uncharacterized protein n=1 Tax=Gluconobacter thailandicus NBRC 3257 TaxID=1381097 RepID=A0ABQ0J0F7_GLUTH|nr:hypothetical protein B932_2710 [Gluconobacter oxydans H24]GAC86723.1 hypothetical protein NBRC3255_0384 [Gluconobacter thailandicus NBRC 3255]GAD27909.1 hypothetical protein NBRC3257_2908 [Gluconobacter thailandicus NBRC 3257]